MAMEKEDIIEMYYDHVLKTRCIREPYAKLFDIIRDLTGRRGLRQEWDQIDDDIKVEIMWTWLEIIRRTPND